MTDPLVIVSMARIDASTENINATRGNHGTWIFRIPQGSIELLTQAMEQLDQKVLEHIGTVIVCNAAEDSYARERCVLSERNRPTDVLNSIGVGQIIAINNFLPNADNIFKIDAACASGIFSLDIADMIARNKNTVVLVAGIDRSATSFFVNMFRNIGAVTVSDEQYFSPFDQKRCGFSIGEGAGIIAVTTESRARELNLDIIAVIDSIGTKTIVTHATSPSESSKLEYFINDIVKNSGRKLSEFAAWDAHATATPAGDLLEYQLFSKIFENESTAISSFKGRIGHCMGASGLIEIINAVQNLKQYKISPNHNLLHPLADDSRLIMDATPTKLRTFIKTSFGFAGRNGAAVITVQ
jgi:3-oxoacyl-(acyl-carrier-protein) synthase